MGSDSRSPATEYTRLVFASTIDWYKSADAKAQVILTLDGVFLAFLTGSAFVKPADLAPLIRHTGTVTWALMALMCIALTGSILCAILCLRSRMDKEGSQTSEKEGKEPVMAPDPYRPAHLFFFQHLATLDPARLATTLAQVDETFEMAALAYQMRLLSANVTKKHFWARWGFDLTGATLLLFLCAAVSHVAYVGTHPLPEAPALRSDTVSRVQPPAGMR